ncbi:MAG: ribosome-binding factor A [Sulfurimonas sp. RIFOXYD12_FULL_33_39]|uniref:30S ribosome-binding factor RbfA n=1 Tax=unclassified Sulfurimonas TaxID=2623549 RepID=UPI0008C70B36|nr:MULTISPECIES: 30S ribosome-binding factor RbfA [unclassified Sulfurimonas]OHE07059.1 MAG: ribosome-binding factor A [Sulfurimonas sp. RIFCSPLOWO2_12_FULL_34_6]OHE10655.1 MAG: ribosome-binding factor A [Sulfurimonas sp. RIFOXYD12_FULL_33_39]OHE13168.1 MAG: ribosome-binding factor A [Sulfurimonas sp. RIFOXYD2_FULL_34_21]DAB27490.1 MAG TPA: ribosome-binding factor A [Sulfurimonas sp. UBA10385]
MTESEIKVKRTESILLELIPEALGSLNDKRLHQLDIIDIKCSRGRSDAKVYIDPASFSQEEKSDFLKLLKKARPIIESFCLKDQGWFRSPKFTFEFDEQLKKAQSIEELFKKIAKE